MLVKLQLSVEPTRCAHRLLCVYASVLVGAADEPIELGEEMLVHPKLLRLSFFTLKAFSAFDEPGQGPRNVSEKTAKLAALRDAAQFASSAQRCFGGLSDRFSVTATGSAIAADTRSSG